MKHVVIIASDFIPSSYPPALRIRNFVRYLPEFDWQPTVVTVNPKYYEWAVDFENEKLLPGSLEVIRTKALPAALTRKIGIGDISIRSLWHHWRVIAKLCHKRKPDLIFISVPPSFSALLGRFIHDSFGVPYVIDYIDPWVSTLYRKLARAFRPRKRPLSYALSRVLEPYVLRRAGHITSVSRKTVDDIIDRYPWLSPDDGTEIPYGGEASDFDYVRRNGRSNQFFQRDDGFFHIGCVGRGGDDMKPALRAIFHAVRIGLERSPRLFERIRLHFVGTTYAPKAKDLYQILPIAEELGVQDLVEESPGRVSYLEALKILTDSHALLAVGSNAPHYTASKIFPYILSRRPILSIFHEASNVVTILKETQAGEAITFNSEHPPMEKVGEIFHRLKEILSLPVHYQNFYNSKAFELYSAKAMTRRLVQVFDRIIQGETR